MLLPGRLSATTLGDLLGALHRERVTGVLELAETRGVPGRRHRIHFLDGLVARVETELAVDTLGELLRRRGVVSRDALEELARQLASGDARASGEILIALGLADEEAVALGLSAQMRERIDALFALEDATIRFHVARPSTARLRPALPPEQFLHDRPRRRDRARGELRTLTPRERALAVLGLDREASEVDVRRAFRRLASEHHPDGKPRASADDLRRRVARLAELSAAYHALVA